MTDERIKTRNEAAIAKAKAKLEETLAILETPLREALERRDAVKKQMRPGRDDDEAIYARVDAAHGRIELFAEAIRAAIEVAP